MEGGSTGVREYESTRVRVGMGMGGGEGEGEGVMGQVYEPSEYEYGQGYMTYAHTGGAAAGGDRGGDSGGDSGDDGGDDGAGSDAAIVWCFVLGLGSVAASCVMLYLFHTRPRLSQQAMLKPLWNEVVCELVWALTLLGKSTGH